MTVLLIQPRLIFIYLESVFDLLSHDSTLHYFQQVSSTSTFVNFLLSCVTDRVK